MWQYIQATGQILANDGVLLTVGYAGHGVGLNNPLLQDDPSIGPIPVGIYYMQPPVDTASHGPYVIWLTPDLSNQMFGRSAFGIHGDEVENPGLHLASEGCIIADRLSRQRVWASNDHILQVLANVAPAPSQSDSGPKFPVDLSAGDL
jgi:Protein of unknown function (DUF2778)